MCSYRIMAAISLSAAVFRAGAYEVTGVVTDSVGEPESFATYRIYHTGGQPDASIANVCGLDGMINQSLTASGNYRMVVSSIGRTDREIEFDVDDRNPVASLGRIVLYPSATALTEVIVTASKPLVTKEIDRVGYDVQADASNKTSTLIEMLRKVPMVSVDADNTIKINGSSDFKIYKNGRPNNSMTNNAKDVLAAIPASMIKRIEVITEPGAKYDAEGVGAILNIVTLENTLIKGVMGNVQIKTQTNNWTPGGSLWLSSQIDKVTFAANGGYMRLSDKMSRRESVSDYVYDSGNGMRSYSDVSTPGYLTYFGADASYEMDSLNLFTAEFMGYYYDVSPHGEGYENMLAPDNSTIYGFKALFDYPSYNYLDLDANFNYQRSTGTKGETITASYMISTTDQDNEENTWYHDMVNMPVAYSGILSKYRLRFVEHTFQLDWTRPLAGIHVLDFGAKYILRRNHSVNDHEYIDSHTTHDDFSHVTHVGALYGQYSLRLGKVGLRGGLRYEFSRLKASYADDKDMDYSSNLNDLVPSAAFSWQIDDANSLTFNYAARINRPGISFLNPAVSETPVRTDSGNPNLSSARHHSMKLTYMLIRPKFNFNISANYELSDNGIAQYTEVMDDHIYSTYLNIGKVRKLDFNAFVQWSITPKTQFMLNGGAYYHRFSQNGLRLGRWGWSGYARLSQDLPWKLGLEVSAFRIGEQVDDVYGYFSMRGLDNVMINVGLSRNFLKEDRLTVKITAQNPVGKSKRAFVDTYVNGGFKGTMSNIMHDMRFVEFSMSYRFGSLNAQVKKTAAKIENDDLSGRKKESK